jgi:hypothetical protein
MFKYRILSFVYGEKIIEAFALDMMLSALDDGLPRSYNLFTTPTGDISVWDISRKSELLIADDMVKMLGDNVLITSKGKLHLSKGGYVGEIKAHKRILFSFWLSVFAVLVSVTTAVISWLNR